MLYAGSPVFRMTTPETVLLRRPAPDRLTKRRIRMALLLTGDLAASLLAWIMAVAISSWAGRFEWTALVPLATLGGTVFTLMSLLVVGALAFNGQYGRRSAFWEEVRVIWRYVATAALVNFALNFLVQVNYTRTVQVLAWLFILINVPVGRLVARSILIRYGLWKRKALILGDGENADQARNALRAERHMGIDIVAAMRADGSIVALGDTGVVIAEVESIAGGLDHDLDAVANGLDCEVIVVALEEGASPDFARITASLHEQAYEIFVVPALRGIPVQGLQAVHFFSDDVLFLRVQHKLFGFGAKLIKRSLDIIASLALMVMLSPLMAWVCWRIWREDGGPVLYSHPRVGKDGKDFEFIKFRSMVKDADARLEAWRTAHPELYQSYEDNNFKLPHDPRVLKVGQWIRSTSIDELPQLWNVLRGDMSLVGPRPLLRRELPAYPDNSMVLYKAVLPGITGLWQVSGRSTTSFAQRALLDTWYVRNWSLWVDWVILLKTVRVVLSRRGAM